MAKAGKGSPFIVPEKDIGTLNEHVIQALQESLEPFMSDCKLTVNLPSYTSQNVQAD